MKFYIKGIAIKMIKVEDEILEKEIAIVIILLVIFHIFLFYNN